MKHYFNFDEFCHTTACRFKSGKEFTNDIFTFHEVDSLNVTLVGKQPQHSRHLLNGLERGYGRLVGS